MWILVIMLLASSQGKAIDSIEFTSRAACQSAAQKVEKAASAAGNPVETLCVPKSL